MRIIKLQVETIEDRTVHTKRYAVGLDMKRYTKISHFIRHIQKICLLDGQSYQLEYDGFIVPNNDKTKALQEDHIYRLKICNNTINKKDYQIKSSQIESEQEDANYESVRKNRNERSNSQRKSKAQQKLEKIIRKNKNKSSSLSGSEQSSDSSSEGEEDQSSDSSSQSSSEIKRKIRFTSNPKNTHLQVLQKQTKKPAPRPLLKKELAADTKKEKTFQKKKIPEIQKKAASSSDSSYSSQLQKITIIKQSKNKVAAKNATIIASKDTKQKQHSNLPRNVMKAVINDSSSQSEPSQTPPVKKPPISIKLAQESKIVDKNIEKGEVDKPKNELKLLPPALRNKFVKKNFDQHKQNQWISIDKQSLKKWQQLGNKTVCQPNNKIRFKIVQLDQQKFIPVKSGWITGEVKAVEPSGVINLVKVEQQGKPYQEKYEIPQHNMDELQINKLLATKQQLQFFEQKQQKEEKQPNKPQPTQQKPVQKVEQVASNDKNSIEKYICGQANYYFSDKNYNFDLFMQMHANRHPQKYLNLSVLLNFPKIKKVLYDKQKLYQYLKDDQKYDQRTYEIDFQNLLIRKKGIFIEPPKSQEPVAGEQIKFAQG